MNNRTVLYFEDTPERAAEIQPALTKHLAGVATVEHFEATSDTDEMFDARLEAEIRTRQDAGKDIVFIVSDADLSKVKYFKGLSDTNVRKVSTAAGIPSAYYSSNLTGINFLKADQAGDGRILLDASDVDELAVEVDALVRGFINIAGNLAEIVKMDQGTRPQDTGALLANLLGRPDLANRVRLFISGDQRMGAELLSSPDHELRRQASIFGTWIYDSLLKYPGLVVNEVAAASYLNIAEDDFADPAVRSLFKAALYSGPFACESRSLWWRDQLDELLLEADAEDGVAFVSSRIGKVVAQCKCSESGEAPAGFYCMVTKKPVSEEYSVGGISWFPPGADLARIVSTKYDELAPWLGL
ncbi:hypothetical protein [Janthinobacterium sp. YR213]|uniref:hypothetical protein n=1 Tax=Janthinobacterium sp. YR213 TaxID=1881027 RepID=UPI00087E8615|nr:hypothetical protein [Janthinobacterium sp. YR213]SDG77167.1 hypothetical protein SAMN05428968_0818 [Janthinobacterium sp. YR213]